MRLAGSLILTAMTLACTPTSKAVPRPALETVNLSSVRIPLLGFWDDRETILRSISFDLAHIPGGTLDRRGKDEGPGKRVKIGAFWMGRHEISWEEYWTFYWDLDRDSEDELPYHEFWWDPTEVMKNLPGFFEGKRPPNHGSWNDPATNISWQAARQYCRWLSKKTGDVYRLPTEAEWEYACREKKDGPSPTPLSDQAWVKENSNDKSHEVGLKKPNPFGLQDMLGNVWEHVADLHDTLPIGSDEFDPITHKCPLGQVCPHVMKGGSYRDPASMVSADTRQKSLQEWNSADQSRPRNGWWLLSAPQVGFRVVREENGASGR